MFLSHHFLPFIMPFLRSLNLFFIPYTCFALPGCVLPWVPWGWQKGFLSQLPYWRLVEMCLNLLWQNHLYWAEWMFLVTHLKAEFVWSRLSIFKARHTPSCVRCQGLTRYLGGGVTSSQSKYCSDQSVWLWGDIGTLTMPAEARWINCKRGECLH